MMFYSNISKEQVRLVFLWLTEDEAKHIGGDDPIGTRLAIKPNNGDERTFLLTPNPDARARLHPVDAAGKPGAWEISFATPSVKDFPTTGRTVLRHRQIEGGFMLEPFDSEIVEPKKSSASTRTRTKPTQRQELPLNKPPKEEVAASIARRTMVGIAATEQEIRDAIEIINDVMARVPEDVKVDLRIENDRVRARIHTYTDI